MMHIVHADVNLKEAIKHLVLTIYYITTRMEFIF